VEKGGGVGDVIPFREDRKLPTSLKGETRLRNIWGRPDLGNELSSDQSAMSTGWAGGGRWAARGVGWGGGGVPATAGV
jgi:hypothetical protein